MTFAADVERMLATLPNAVTVRFREGCSRGPLDAASPERSDGSGGSVRGTLWVLSLPAAHLPRAIVGTVIACEDEAGTVQQYRVHDRAPAQGDALVHELVLVEVG